MERLIFLILGAVLGGVVGLLGGSLIGLGATLQRPGHPRTVDPLWWTAIAAIFALAGACAGGYAGFTRGAGLGKLILDRFKQGSDNGYVVGAMWLGILAGGIGAGLGVGYGLALSAPFVVGGVVLGAAMGGFSGMWLGAAWSALLA